MERGIEDSGKDARELTRENTQDGKPMPPRTRPQSSSNVFHVINRGNAHQTLFRAVSDFIRFHQLIKKLKQRYQISLYYYVFMPNHIHIMIETQNFEDVSHLMRDLTSTYARYNHRQYEGDGHVWTGRFRLKIIEKDSYLKQCGVYIEANPVRAGLAKNPEDYPWSSARAHICKMPDSIVDPCPYIYQDSIFFPGNIPGNIPGKFPGTESRHPG